MREGETKGKEFHYDIFAGPHRAAQPVIRKNN